MKKTLGIIIILLIVITIIVSILLYREKKENERIDAEAVTLKENLIVEYGANARVSDFIENLNGVLLNDYQINTEQIGKIEVKFEFLNIKNKQRQGTFYIETIDENAPKIFSSSSYTVKKGYNKRLEDVLISGDDIDDNPVRRIEGEYDFNEIGNYPLTYVVTDSSGNETRKNFTLHVVEKTESVSSEKETKNFADMLEKYKKKNTKIGIDVSKWQEDIDWRKVKQAGAEFAIIRMGYQTDYDGELMIDPYFIKNMNGAEMVGLPVGLYFYSYAKNVEQAEEQAEWVKNQIKDYNIDLPIAFDWESWSSFNKTGMSFYKINKVANTFLDTITKEGKYEGMLYSSKNYLEKIWYPTKYNVWLAHYTNETNYDGNYYIWQMCDTGKIDGINGNVDIDIMYVNKNQTIEKF